MITINSTVYDENLQLSGVLSESHIKQSITYTFGKPVVQSIVYPVGRVLTLSASQDGERIYGIFTYTQIQELIAIRDTVQTVVFVHPKFTGNVIIPSGGLSFTDVDDLVENCSDALYIGTVEFLTV